MSCRSCSTCCAVRCRLLVHAPISHMRSRRCRTRRAVDLLVTPGVTGLWQVSGRSDLHEEDGIKLDLRYVENWSLTYDLQILVEDRLSRLGSAWSSVGEGKKTQ